MPLPKNTVQLVGRSHEKNILRNLLRRAGQAQGQVAFISGEAGIGKTRLLAYLIDLAESNGFVIIRGECVEEDRNFPYAPIIDGLRAHFSGVAPEEIGRIISPFQSEFAKLLPELTLGFAETSAAVALEPEAEKRRLFEVLIQVYQRLAASGLLLIFEDVHWSDANSLEFFHTLTRRISMLPIMAALSSRLTTPDGGLRKLRLNVDRAANAESIQLRPLSEDEIQELIKSALETTYTIHPGVLERLKALAQGNPLYAEQIVFTLRHNRQLNLVNGTWMVTGSEKTVNIPTSMKQMAAEQMERLSEPARHIARLAAVAGRHFELNALQKLTGFDEPQLIAAVKELMQHRFFEEVSRERFMFRHALLREAIHDDLLIRERQSLHQALLQILAESASAQSDAHLAELSHHAYQAEEWEAALQYGVQAGQHALALHSPRAAVEHFTQAVEAAGQLGDGASWELYMQRGKALDNLGEFQQALDDYEAALQAAERSGDQEATWQTLIAIALLWSARDYHRAEDYCKRALQLAQAMEAPKLIGHSLNRLGNWRLNTGRPYEALDYHEQALAVFEELDDLPGKGETLDLLGMTSGQVLRSEAAHDYYHDAIAIFRQLDDRKALASSLANQAINTLDQPLAEEAVEIARQIGWYSGEAYACVMLGYMHSFYGRFSESLSYLQRGRELARAIDHMQWLAAAHFFSAVVYRDMLDLTTAADHAEQGVALAAEVGSHWFADMGSGLLARILIEQGQLEAAQEILASRPMPDSPAMQHMMLMLAENELALARGQAETALASSEQMYRMLDLARASGPSSAIRTLPCLIAQAQAYALADRHADALLALERARRMSADWGLLPVLWQVEVLIGEITLHQDSDAAEQCFRRARDYIKQLAVNIPADKRRGFLQTAYKMIPASEASHASSHQLTPREIDIAKEIARGKTNQQIADDLHITIKTVEAHITRVLSKLDLTSRTQIALWAVENKLTPHSE